MIEQYVTPALVLGVGIFLWQVFGKRFDGIDKRIDDLRQDIGRLNERLDRHLEGHS